MSGFAPFEHVSWKVSGLVTEADWTRWQPVNLQPFVDHVLQVIGPDRMIFGSDWPVCLLAASYERVLATAEEVLAGLSESEHDGVFGGNAAAIYGL